MEISHIHNQDGLNNALLSQGYIPEAAPSVGMVGGTHVPMTGKGGREGPPDCPCSANSSQVNW